MPAFFLAFLAALALTATGREGVRAARLSAGIAPPAGAPPGLLLALWLSAIATSALAAWAGALLAPQLPGAARQMFVALALVVAAVELVLLRAPPAPAEPTRSLGAVLLVFLASQLTDSTRLVVAALALATGEPLLAAAGGALGSGAALTLAALGGASWEKRLPLRALAIALAAALLLAAAVIGLAARGLLT